MTEKTEREACSSSLEGVEWWAVAVLGPQVEAAVNTRETSKEPSSIKYQFSYSVAF